MPLPIPASLGDVVDRHLAIAVTGQQPVRRVEDPIARPRRRQARGMGNLL